MIQTDRHFYVDLQQETAQGGVTSLMVTSGDAYWFLAGKVTHCMAAALVQHQGTVQAV